jgi:2-dehydropantoate 2-reductase
VDLLLSVSNASGANAGAPIVDNAAMTDDATPSNTPAWHVLGTGSMACLWAASLAACGHEVSLIARDRSRQAAYHGITLESAAGGEHVEPALETRESASPIAQLLVCTKAYDALEALAGIAHRLAPDAAVVLLQNGMGFHDEALNLVGSARLFCALSTEGAWCPAPFHVRHAGRGVTLLGRYPRGPRGEAEALARTLPSRRLEIRPVEDIEHEMWRKLAVNCTINALTAVHGCPNGALLEPGAASLDFAALCTETAMVLEALGQHEIAAELPATAAEVARRTAANRSSMLQDVQARRRTEIDYINGFLCRRAEAADVPCPFNRALCARIHALEQNYHELGSGR